MVQRKSEESSRNVVRSVIKPMNPQNSFLKLTIYFGLFATIVAGMIGLGRGSWNLALLVGLCAIVSVLYTDILGWYSLNRWFVYLGMVVGAGVAIVSFFADSSSSEIVEVGNLLVYVQIPLMFQKKSKRVFEQWGVFLLLELVVAALVNDNVIYGLLTFPVLVVGCATMMALAQFASELRHSESISESTSSWSKILHWLGKEQLVTKQSSGVTLSAVRRGGLVDRGGNSGFAPSKLLHGILPMAICILLFSIAYFYSLPRFNTSSYQGGGGGASVGFSEKISLRQIGDMLQNDTPLFRMTMRENRTNTTYRPNSPPYIRASVSQRYLDGPAKGNWQPNVTAFLEQRLLRDAPVASEIDNALAEYADKVLVDVVEKKSLEVVLPMIVPHSQTSNNSGLQVVRRDWRTLNGRDSVFVGIQKRRFSYLTYAFRNGEELPLLPDVSDCLVESGTNPSAVSDRVGYYRNEEVLEFPESLEAILPFRDRVLSESKMARPGKLEQALALEDYLSNSKEFRYTLSLTKPVDGNVDPIVDFLLNKKRGHCQFFASSLAMLLRSLDIPSRVVVGFRPGDYNEVGDYFLVLQNHAHVWVEAYFTREELEGGRFEVPSYINRGAWLRLDATPPGDGSNAGGAFRSSNGQTLDVMQDLWTEMVLNMDKSKQSTMLALFGEASNAPYADMLRRAKAAWEGLTSNKILQVLLSPGLWFSWQSALIFMLIGSCLVLVYRLLLWRFPAWIPRIRLRRASNQRSVSSVDFYNRIARSLKQIGVQRGQGETQLEYFHAGATALRPYSIALDADWLAELFYARRFGGLAKLSKEDQLQMEKVLQTLELEVPLRRRTGAKSGGPTGLE